MDPLLEGNQNVETWDTYSEDDEGGRFEYSGEEAIGIVDGGEIVKKGIKAVKSIKKIPPIIKKGSLSKSKSNSKSLSTKSKSLSTKSKPSKNLDAPMLKSKPLPKKLPVINKNKKRHYRGGRSISRFRRLKKLKEKREAEEAMTSKIPENPETNLE